MAERTRKIKVAYDPKGGIVVFEGDGKKVSVKAGDFPRAIQEMFLIGGITRTLLGPANDSFEKLEKRIALLKSGVWAPPAMGKQADPRRLLAKALVYIAEHQAPKATITETVDGKVVSGFVAALAQVKAKSQAWVEKARTAPEVVAALAAIEKGGKAITVDVLVKV